MGIFTASGRSRRTGFVLPAAGDSSVWERGTGTSPRRRHDTGSLGRMEGRSKASELAPVKHAMIPTVSIICDFREEHWASMDQVAETLLRELNRSHSRTLLARRIRPAMVRLPVAGRMPKLARAMQRACNRYIYYPGYLRWTRLQSDIFHVIDHSYAHLVHELPAERTVVTCHDVDAFRCLVEPDQVPMSWLFRRISRRILEGLQKAAAVVCVSQVTREALLKYGLTDPARTHVVHNGVDPAFWQRRDFAAELEVERPLAPRDIPRDKQLHHVNI